MSQTVRKAVFPVAGLGTRFLPATKAVPKEMLPIVDRPLIQYAVEEAVAAGVTEIIFVNSPTKGSIEEHFRQASDLEAALDSQGRPGLLEALQSASFEGVRFKTVVQAEPLGLGHAILQARDAVGDEPFFVVLPDDLMIGEPGCMTQMLAPFERIGTSVIVTQQVPEDQTDRYGIVTGERTDERLMRMTGIVEKPAPADAPSVEAVVGRYLLTPDIWQHLDGLGQGAGGEIQLTDALAAQIDNHGVHAFSFDGERYDCGSKLGFLEATVALALADPEVSDGFREALRGLV
jgi:UTP--glucose-1-phosphate uridylyltransferase